MYNRFNYTYTQAQPILAEVERYLAAYAEKVPEAEHEYLNHFNLYIFDNRKYITMKKEIGYQMKPLFYAGWMEEIPWDKYHSALFVYKQAPTDGTLTLSKTHVRLPQLSFLITLTPKDFFLFFNTIANQKNLLHFELAEDEIPARFKSWFSKYYKGQRINSKIADRRWVPRYVIDTIAEMWQGEIKDEADEQSAQLLQLAAMQYITVMRDDSLVSVPVSTVLALELDWEQIKDADGQDTDYCISMPDSTSFVLLGR